MLALFLILMFYIGAIAVIIRGIVGVIFVISENCKSVSSSHMEKSNICAISSLFLLEVKEIFAVVKRLLYPQFTHMIFIIYTSQRFVVVVAIALYHI